MAAEGFEAYHVPQQSRRDKLRGQGLSLSLSSHNHHQRNSISSTSNNSTVPLELNLQRSLFTTTVQAAAAAADCCNNEFLSTKSTGATTIVGPFTGYASILKGSRFLKHAQQLMQDISGIYAQKLLQHDHSLGTMDHVSKDEHTRNNTKLISMLDEVYRRYKEYYEQLQGVVASFESVPGLGNAAPFANLSLKALTKHFRCLKKAISDQMKCQTHSEINCYDSTSIGKGNFNYNNLDRAGYVWRPQRGLPERAVTVLRAWLFDHFLHPYPTDSDKVMLAKQTGLSRNQVSNWFINARVRLWKPMVEEIHMLETNKCQIINNNPIEVHFPTNNNTSLIPSAQQVPSKRRRIINNQEMNLSSSGGVSLTLGLHHQNNNNALSFPRNAARRFGIDANIHVSSS